MYDDVDQRTTDSSPDSQVIVEILVFLKRIDEIDLTSSKSAHQSIKCKKRNFRTYKLSNDDLAIEITNHIDREEPSLKRDIS